jgi:hypothetical protein
MQLVVLVLIWFPWQVLANELVRFNLFQQILLPMDRARVHAPIQKE